ncbi:hypothetical protein Caci_7329 [Catenulispora acidiphila DSM 44928]|uniref:Uncharacterized protein n=1 Tax=Catenulispora acidiphila (strain DSM 44928 / JCM 14897 / NBRC 102108 / NRRL B-24433 / ID139908) TaxID=479433 RepID=C7Q8H0_CATAD|nr:hypothetical protein Caci_7329 [Catenulispora acidiphila DSM 44928]
MSQSPQDVPVHVTAEVRPPALRKLARACITLARLQLSEPPQDKAVKRPSVPEDTEANR